MTEPCSLFPDNVFSGDQPEKAILLQNLAQKHPFVVNSHWFADVVESRVTAAAANLSPKEVAAAQARGKEMDMWKTAESLLRELEDQLSASPGD